jgi:hypothetical protein
MEAILKDNLGKCDKRDVNYEKVFYEMAKCFDLKKQHGSYFNQFHKLIFFRRERLASKE